MTTTIEQLAAALRELIENDAGRIDHERAREALARYDAEKKQTQPVVVAVIDGMIQGAWSNANVELLIYDHDLLDDAAYEQHEAACAQARTGMPEINYNVQLG